jgi:nucleotide-binding universal stress UspA family protein
MSIGNLLVATDIEGQNELALLRALQLARLSGATLHVLHIARRPGGDAGAPGAADKDETVAGIREFIQAHSASPDPECVIHVEHHGRIHERITEYARSVHAELVILGRSERAAVLPESVLLTTGQVVANAAVPVLVVTQPVAGDYRAVLLEVEMGESPGGLLKVISALGAGTRVTLLVSACTGEPQAGFLARLLSSARLRMQRAYIENLQAHARAAGIPASRISFEFVPDDYASALTAKLADSRFDVIGLTRMDKRLRHRASGQHMIGAIQAASCDILIELQ